MSHVDNLGGAIVAFLNYKTGTCIDLGHGYTADGSKIFGFQFISGLNQQWKLEREDQGAVWPTWKLRNVQSATYVVMGFCLQSKVGSGGRPTFDPPATLVPDIRQHPLWNRKWHAAHCIRDIFADKLLRIQNVATSTYIDLWRGNPANETMITGYGGLRFTRVVRIDHDEVANLGYSRDRYRHIGYANIKPRSWHIDLTTLERTASLNLLRQAARIHPDEGFSTVLDEAGNNNNKWRHFEHLHLSTSSSHLVRLINVHTKSLEDFIDDTQPTPPYAILSHTWGPDHEELFFQDLQADEKKTGPGRNKFEACCTQAIQDNLFYAWIDTCCIDKTNSTELSEG
ncbi:hypothetical protein CIB48_g12332 [Xylaria polymorpha]|nr:hypothetical protein CIB48_g12332 [Xylaria polymorpha]